MQRDRSLTIGSGHDDFWRANGNKSIPVASQALADAILDRQDLFTGAEELKFVFDGVEGSVKGQYGQTSLQYKAISGISW